MRIAITGSSGMIGQTLAAFFRGRGDTVTSIVRGEPSKAKDPSKIRWDYQAREIDHRGLERHDAVIHLAGANVGERWSKEYKKDIEIYLNKIKEGWESKNSEEEENEHYFG